jgi:hypothetical protein
VHSDDAAPQRWCCTFYWPWEDVQLCGPKTIFLRQTSILLIFFVQFYCAGSHSEHRRRWSKYSCILQPLDTTTDSKGPMPLVYSSKRTVTTYNGCKTLYVWSFNLQWVANLVWDLNQ